MDQLAQKAPEKERREIGRVEKGEENLQAHRRSAEENQRRA